MKMEHRAEVKVAGMIDMARHYVSEARNAEDTDAMKEAIRIARLNLINAYDAITEAEQAARAKYWTMIA